MEHRHRTIACTRLAPGPALAHQRRVPQTRQFLDLDIEGERAACLRFQARSSFGAWQVPPILSSGATISSIGIARLNVKLELLDGDGLLTSVTVSPAIRR